MQLNLFTWLPQTNTTIETTQSDWNKHYFNSHDPNNI